MVLPVRIELTTSALPRMRSTTELRQHDRHGLSAPASKAAPMALQCLACQGKLRDCGAPTAPRPRRQPARTRRAIIRDSHDANALHLGPWPNMTPNAKRASPKPCAPICAGAKVAAAPRSTSRTIQHRANPPHVTPRQIRPDTQNTPIVGPHSAFGQFRQSRSGPGPRREKFKRVDDAGRAGATAAREPSDARPNSHPQHGPA